MTESFPSKIFVSGGDLPDGEYVINANSLNQQYDNALKYFDMSEVHEEGSTLYIYFRALWNGYAAAITGIRNRVRNNPVDPTLMSWQPIATAPLDKTILVYRPDHRLNWCSVAPARYESDQYAKNPRPYWRSRLDYNSKLDDRKHPPTHWMPLPSAPVNEEP